MTPEKAKIGTSVTVQRKDDTSKSIQVIVNDRGPYQVDSSGRAVRPLQPHPDRVIDLTRSSFEKLTGGDTDIGKIPVIVTVPTP